MGEGFKNGTSHAWGGEGVAGGLPSRAHCRAAKLKCCLFRVRDSETTGPQITPGATSPTVQQARLQ